VNGTNRPFTFKEKGGYPAKVKRYLNFMSKAALTGKYELRFFETTASGSSGLACFHGYAMFIT